MIIEEDNFKRERANANEKQTIELTGTADTYVPSRRKYDLPGLST